MHPTTPTIKETQFDVTEKLYFAMIRAGIIIVDIMEAKVSIQADTYARRAIPFLTHLKEM